MIKLVVTDLDGTFLNNKGVLIKYLYYLERKTKYEKKS